MTITEEKSDVLAAHRHESIPEETNLQAKDNIEQEYASSEDLADALENQNGVEEEKESLPFGYSINDEGLFYSKVKGESDSGKPSLVRIGDELHVIAAVSNSTGGEQARVVQFHERTRDIEKKVTLSLEALYRDNGEALSFLASEGYRFSFDRGVKSLLVGYITKAIPSKVLFSVSRCGWMEDKTFVLPHIVVSEVGLNDIHYTGPVQPEVFLSKGTLDLWKQRVALPTYDHPPLIFSICSALAAPLLRILKISGGGFHFHGASGTGKTTALKVAASVVGSEGYITTWRATSNGLEATSEAYNDLLLPLDEIHQIDPEEIPENVYLIANGRGRQRANRQGDRKLSKSWNVLTLSCGESSIEDLCKKLPEGARNRLVDVEFGEQVPASVCGALLEAVKEEHGTAIIAFLRYVISNIQPIQEEWREYKKNFDKASGTVDRVMSRFFMINFAGALAYRADILPKDPSPILGKLFEKISVRYKETSENPKMIEVMRKYIMENSSKIHSIKNQLCREIVGVAILGERQSCGAQQEGPNETVEFILLGEPIKAHLALLGYSLSGVIKALREEGLLNDPEEGRGLKKRFVHPFLNKRVDGYPISARILTHE